MHQLRQHFRFNVTAHADNIEPGEKVVDLRRQRLSFREIIHTKEQKLRFSDANGPQKLVRGRVACQYPAHFNISDNVKHSRQFGV
ncbi:MAG: hypothetical protein ABJF23_03680 [Bryobacteraceae bacterium]